jgi:hypothetical protein
VNIKLFGMKTRITGGDGKTVGEREREREICVRRNGKTMKMKKVSARERERGHRREERGD